MASNQKSVVGKAKDGWEKKAVGNLGKNFSFAFLRFWLFFSFLRLSFAEKEVKILSAKVGQFEGLEKMFLELLKVCEQFEERVTELENQLSQV